MNWRCSEDVWKYATAVDKGRLQGTGGRQGPSGGTARTARRRTHAQSMLSGPVAVHIRQRASLTCMTLRLRPPHNHDATDQPSPAPPSHA